MKYTQYVSHSTEVMGGEKCDSYTKNDIATSEAIHGELLANNSFILRVMGHLLGKVLTTVEATTTSQSQAKAIKDLMRGHFSQEMEFVGNMLFDQTVLDQLATESLENVSDDEIFSVSIDTVLGIDDKS